MIKDIEDLIREVTAIFKENMDCYVIAMDKEKNDNMLEESYSLADNAYYEWYFEEYPEYSPSFVLGVAPNARIITEPNMPEVAITYTLQLSIVIADNGLRHAEKAKSRYNRIIRDILFDKVFPKFGEVCFTYEDVQPGIFPAPNDVVYESSTTTFTATIGGA